MLGCKGERYCRVRARGLHRLVGRVPSRGESCNGYSCKQTLDGMANRRIFTFLAAWSLRQERAGLLAPEEPAEPMPMAAYPLIDFFGNPDHAGNPKRQRQGHEQRQ